MEGGIPLSGAPSHRNREMMVRASMYRDGCISCAACWILCPEFFEQDPEDKKSRVVEAYRIQGEAGEGVVPGEMDCCIREAACCCTVQVIVLNE